jgi:16S rRNA U516 pseudouridylate synthase RsuA-like enzyme
MFDAVGHPVVRLKRVRIGPIEDPEMPPGHWRELTSQEIGKLQKACGLTTSPRLNHKGTKTQRHEERKV